MSNEAVKQEKRKGGKIALVICILIIVALCILIWFLLHKDDKSKRDVVVNEENVDEILSQLDDRQGDGVYQVTMNSTWHFEDGTASSDNAYVENAKANKNPVYFDLTRSDTNEKIYESPIIPVGSHLEEITLDSKLKAGTYDCVMTYYLVDDEEEIVSTVKVSVEIVIDH